MAQKIYTYLFLAIGLMTLLVAAGIPTTSSYILGSIGFTSPSGLINFQSSAFYLVIIATLTSLAGAAIAMGLLGRTVTDIPVTSALATGTLIVFIGDFISIVGYANDSAAWMGWLVFLLLAPFIGGFIFALYDWVRGKD